MSSMQCRFVASSVLDFNAHVAHACVSTKVDTYQSR